MKKLFILPVFVLFITGASSTNVEPQISHPVAIQQIELPVNTKLDSITIKAAELTRLIQQL